jgi:hypothetical protein
MKRCHACDPTACLSSFHCLLPVDTFNFRPNTAGIALGAVPPQTSGVETVLVRFWLTLTYDRDRRFNLMESRFAAVEAVRMITTEGWAGGGASVGDRAAAASKTQELESLSIMTFNVCAARVCAGSFVALSCYCCSRWCWG